MTTRILRQAAQAWAKFTVAATPVLRLLFPRVDTYDAAALARMTASLAKQAGAPIPPQELAKLPLIVMADDGVYVYDREVGLMREVIVSRRVSVGANRRLDGWQVRLLKGPR